MALAVCLNLFGDLGRVNPVHGVVGAFIRGDAPVEKSVQGAIATRHGSRLVALLVKRSEPVAHVVAVSFAEVLQIVSWRPRQDSNPRPAA